MRNPVVFGLIILPLAMLATSCGGASGDSSPPPPAIVASTPPAPSPAPTPTPPTSVADLATPMFSATPPLPIAASGGQSFIAPGSGARFPLLLTAIGDRFAGDATSTAQGGSLDLAAGGSLSLTLNNPALGLNRTAITGSLITNAPGETVYLSANAANEGINHSRNGLWLITTGSQQRGGVWSTGFGTHASSLPVTGRLTYNGPIRGLISEYHIQGGAGAGLLIGTVTLESDFGQRTVTGKISRLRVGSDGSYKTGPVNDLTFTATFDVSVGQYIGEVLAGAASGGPNALVAGSRGAVVGRFFGAGGIESGAVLTLSDGTSRLIISFSATTDTSCMGCWDY